MPAALTPLPGSRVHAPAFPTSAALSIVPAAVEMFVDALGPKSRVLANQQRTAAPISLKNRVASPTLVPGRLPPQRQDLQQMRTQWQPQMQTQPQPQPQEIQHLVASQGSRTGNAALLRVPAPPP